MSLAREDRRDAFDRALSEFDELVACIEVDVGLDRFEVDELLQLFRLRAWSRLVERKREARS